MRHGGFAYKIDHDAAIRADEAEIARLTDVRLLAAMADMTDDEREDRRLGYLMRPIDFIVRYPERRAARAAIFGATLDDVRAWAWFSLHTTYPDDLPRPQPGDYERGEAWSEKFAWFEFVPEEKRVAALKHAKTRLARHKRNRAKWGA